MAASASTGIFVGSTMVATRFVIDQTDPASLALLRYVIGVICLAAPVAIAARVRFARRDLVPIAVLGIGQFAILIALLNFGLARIPAALGALIFATFPLLTMLLATALGRETLNRFKAGGVLLTVIGVGVALGERLALPAVDSGTWLGIAAVFASALCGAVCSVFYRPYLERYPALPVGAFAMLASVAFLAVLAAGEGFFADPPSFTVGGWLAVAFIGASSAIGYFLWLWALRHTTPTKVAVFLSLSPITATALGAMLLAERISGPFLIGLCLVAAGLPLAHREPGTAGKSSIG